MPRRYTEILAALQPLATRTSLANGVTTTSATEWEFVVAPTATAYPEREVIERFNQSRKVEEDAAPFKALAHPTLALPSAFSTYACIIYSRRECECGVGKD